jgi:benzylsuccinate CoA-transferase BbsE subunit
MGGLMTEGMLAPYRALDLTDASGFLCGKNLGALGCDVIKIEKPGGDKSRNIGPFFNDIYHPEKSLYWFAFNCNKRGITLDIESPDGQEIFKQLVKRADFVIESFPPGYMDSLALGYSDLSLINDQIIVTSITPFGDSGPYKDFKASDIVGMAMGGILYICGESDRPPVCPTFPTAYLLAASEAAVGTVMALQWRYVAHRGTRVVTSLQDEALLMAFDSAITWAASRRIPRRSGAVWQRSNVAYRVIWACKDGYVSFLLAGGQTGAPGNRAIVEWMDSEGIACERLKQIDWVTFDWDMFKTQDELDRIEKPIAQFFMNHTKAELYEAAIKKDIILYPLATAGDIVESQQLKARGYWTEVEHPELNTSITYPGAFAKISKTSCGIFRRAPLIGEHNQEIYEGELGVSKEEMLSLKQAGII